MSFTGQLKRLISITIILFIIVYFYTFTTSIKTLNNPSFRSITTEETYTPTWSEYIQALIDGGSAQYTRGITSRDTCSDTSPLPSTITGSFSQPSKFWSSQAVVQFDLDSNGNPYSDHKPRLVDLQSSCCKSEKRWPKCFADDVNNIQDRDKKGVLKSIHINSKVLLEKGFIIASLKGGKLKLKCTAGTSSAFYSDSVGAFKWKQFPENTESIDIRSSAVLVRCGCRGLIQRIREAIQLKLKGPYPIPNMAGFQERYEEEKNQCIEHDLMLTQVLEKPSVRRRLEKIWDTKTKSSNHKKKNNEKSNRKSQPPLSILYFHLDSTSRRHWVNNIVETTKVLKDLNKEKVATTFGFPFFHTMGYGTTERAFAAGLGGSSIVNIGTPSLKYWSMLNLIWNRARDAGWFTSFSNEVCFTHEHRDLLKSSNYSLEEKLFGMGDHTMYDAFCGLSHSHKEQYRNGDYHVKNFLGVERSCEGGRRPPSNFLEFTMRVLKELYRGKNGEEIYPSFNVYEWGAAHLFREEYHVCAAIRHFDVSLASFLRELKETGILNRTVLVFSGDHANWNIEEKPNAAVTITVPDWYLNQAKSRRQNLHKNQQEVVTHLDVHSTMMALIKEQTGPNPLSGSEKFSYPVPIEGDVIISKEKHTKYLPVRNWTGWRYGQKTFPGKNLFSPLPIDRTCEMAGIDIEEELYSCLIKTSRMGDIHEVKSRIEENKQFHKLLGEKLTEALNMNVRDEMRPTCKKYVFDSLMSVKARDADTSEHKDFKLTTKFYVQPFSNGAGKRTFHCEVMSSISPFQYKETSRKKMKNLVISVNGNACQQISKWEMNKKCMPKNIAKKEKGFCQCLNDAGLKIGGFRI